MTRLGNPNYRLSEAHILPEWTCSPIKSSPLAEVAVVTFDVIKARPNARRNRYRVQRTEERVPCGYWVDGVLVVHPTIYAKLRGIGGSTPVARVPLLGKDAA